MTRVVIVEDENLAAQKLIRQLGEVDPAMEIVSVLDTVSGAVDFLNTNEVDLIFLDIHLGDDLSFNIFKETKVKTPIIFTTAYDQYAIQAFKLNSVDYLLKPINKSELKEALDKFQENRQVSSVDYRLLVESLQSTMEPTSQKRFMVYKGDKVKTINTAEVAYFFAEGKYVYLVNMDGVEYLIDYTLDKLQSKLEPEQFFRINRQFIIQICAIKEMIAYSKGRLKIELDPTPRKETIVSTDRSSDFKNWLNK
ncbi:MAG: LytTR family DNA-binding domain-containing protein [Reichenbachiella sp.]|uniref:LytR/AlgR family response regulator transcription factor n=1 Tax=Reichenbachiella sp. TaxID=2184521 RepID=UPI003263065F